MAKTKKGAEEDGGKPKKDKKKLIAIVVALAGAWKFGLLPIGGSKDASGTTTTTQMQPGDAVGVGDPMVVNLADTDKDRYARVGIAIVLPGDGKAPTTTTEATSSRRRATTETTEAPSSESATTAADEGATTTTEGATTTEGESGALGAGAPGHLAMAAVPRSEGADPAAALEPKFPRLRAAAISIIRGYTSAELLAADGPTHLEDDLSEAAYEIYGEDEIYGVIITELIVQ